MCVHTAILVYSKMADRNRVRSGLCSQFLTFEYSSPSHCIITFEDDNVVRFYKRLQGALVREDIHSIVHIKTKEHVNLMPLFHKEDI